MISDTEIWRDKVIRIETSFHIIEPIVNALLILCVIRSYSIKINDYHSQRNTDLCTL